MPPGAQPRRRRCARRRRTGRARQTQAQRATGAHEPKAFAPRTRVLTIEDGESVAVTIAELERQPGVLRASPNVIARASFVPNDQGQPGGLGVGGEVTFTFRTNAKKARITAMVHPDVTPDNYVTAVLDLRAGGTTALERFDIGDDEKRYTVQKVGPAGSATIR